MYLRGGCAPLMFRMVQICTIWTKDDLRMSDDTPITMSVPEAGKLYFGLSRNGSYDAAMRGDLPTIKIGRPIRVPVRALEKMLDRAGEPHEAK
jgi:hypothetical protein